jgi:hypothetical protein
VNSVAMLASTMLPTAPFDGAYFRRRRAALTITVLLGIVTTVIALRWV